MTPRYKTLIAALSALVVVLAAIEQVVAERSSQGVASIFAVELVVECRALQAVRGGDAVQATEQHDLAGEVVDLGVARAALQALPGGAATPAHVGHLDHLDRSAPGRRRPR